MEIIHETGVDAELPRYTNGFTHELEDDDVDPSYVNRLMQVVMELFDVQADLAFMLGLEDEYGNTVLQD
ncbi:hypothetical protein N3930_45910, partial [Bacillus thuringiensis]|nr:hypothetical protein [Bacillus thuringiensis]